MTEDQIIEIMARALYADTPEVFGAETGSVTADGHPVEVAVEVSWDDLDSHFIEMGFDEEAERVRDVCRKQARAALSALRASGLTIVPDWSDDMSKAPKDGSYFVAWDRAGFQLDTMHWNKKVGKFLTDHEQWTGDFTYWRPLLPPPGGE